MGGIIAGFLGGVGQGMADAGKMMLSDKLAKEREEADFLRESEFRKNERLSGEKFLTTRDATKVKTDAVAAATKVTTDAVAAETQTKAQIAADKLKAKAKEQQVKDEIAGRQAVADTRAEAAAGNDDTTNMQDAAALIAAGYPKDVANAIAHGALKQVKDEDTGDMVLINALTNIPVGRLTDQGSGQKEWIAEGEIPENAKITSKHRTQAKANASEKAGIMSLDSTDFPGAGGRKQWIRDEAQRIANKERGDEPGTETATAYGQDAPPVEAAAAPQVATPNPQAKAGGIVASQVPDDTKMVGKKRMGREEFERIMVEKYGQGKMAEIEETWNSIK